MLVAKHLNKIFSLTALCLLAVFFVCTNAEATGMEVGTNTFTLSAGQNVYYGLTAAANANGNFLLFEKGAGTAVFKVDKDGNLTSTGNITTTGTISGASMTLTGALSAGNISSGAFGSNTGGGNYSFPASVGIGTTNPQKMLHLYGNGAAIRITDTSGANSDWSITQRGNANGDLNFYDNTNTAVRLMINGAGNVGIGTVAPSQKLDVYNIIALQGKLAFDGGDTWLRLNNSNAFSGGIYAGSGILRTDGEFQVGGNGSIFDVKAGGNVGIGTTNPEQALHVRGSIVQNGFSTAETGIFFREGFSSSSKYNLSLITRNISGSPDSLSLNAYGGITFVTGANDISGERVRITTGGNVGIGTTNPGIDKLYVNGSGNFNSNQIHGVGTPTSGPDAANKSYVDSVIGGGSGSTVGYWSMSGSNIYNSNGGNVGIGTSALTRKLTVQGPDDFNVQLRLQGTGDSASYWELGRESASTGDFRLISNRTGVGIITALSIKDTNGNVGIGTLSPGAYKLNVNGDLNVSGTITSGGSSGTLNAANVSAGSFAANTGGGNFIFPANVTAPIYYDTDTNYYGDFNSTSRVNTVTANLYNGPGTGLTGTATGLTAGGLVNFSVAHAVNPDTKGTTGIHYFAGGATSVYSDGTLIQQAYQSDPTRWGSQIMQDYRTGKLAVRGLNNTNWTTWLNVIDSSTIGSQSVNYAASAGTSVLLTGSNAAYLVTAGDGNGLKFWSSDSYKISMGASALYQYGPVTDYSIKTQMDAGSPGRGFTWGREGVAPIAGLNSTSGNMQIAGTMTAASFSGPYTGTVTAPNVSSGEFAKNTGGGNFIFGATVSGNVGFGTSAPGSNKVNIKSSTPTIASGYGDNTGNMGQLIIEASDSYSTQKGGRIAFSGNAGNGGGAFTGHTRQDSVFGTIEGFKSNASANNAGGGLIFKTDYNPDGQMYERMRIDDTGNVGIGTNAPGEKLEINGNLKFTTANPYISAPSYFIAPGGAYFNGGTVYFTNQMQVRGGIHNDNGSYLSIDGGTSGYTYFGGNVGLGVTDPGEKLDIAGNINFRDITSGRRDVRGIMANNDYWSVGGNPISTNQGVLELATGDDATEPIVARQYSGPPWSGSLARQAYILDGSGNTSFPGTVTAAGFSGALTGTVNAANVSSGTFGSNTGNGNYTFPGDVNITGNNRLYFSSWGGGFYMLDNTWLRSVNNSYIWLGSGWFGSNGGLTLGYGGGSGSNAQAIIAGNVGIGTSVPNSKLHTTETLTVNGGASGSLGNRILVGTNSASQTLEDTNLRPEVYVSGAYPVLTLNHTVTSNTLHGPTIQFTHDGLSNRQFVIGTNGQGTQMDFGYSDGSNNSNHNPHNGIGNYSGSTFMRIQNDGRIGIGTISPSTTLHVNGGVTITNGDLSMPGHQITANKLNVSTIDPLYSIYGTNYASFAASIVGGVKEEVTGKINIDTKVGSEYEYVIDFNTETKGTDLWVWRQVIDFGKDGVEAQITPYGKFANTYYDIQDNKIIVRADRPVEVSYRFIGKRFDWKQWPTLPKDQTEKAGLIIK